MGEYRYSSKNKCSHQNGYNIINMELGWEKDKVIGDFL